MKYILATKLLTNFRYRSAKLLWFSLCLGVSAVSLSCGSKPTDMRSLVPADSLIYLETNDLAAALQPIIDNEVFANSAKSKPDLSGLKGVQLAVTVSGFEMIEEKLTDEHSVGRVQPRFVAIADTHAWNWGAVAFAESQLGAFVLDIYRSDVAQERVEKHGGTFFTWAANDGRKAFALVIDSLVYFSNDESAIEKCLAVKRGEGDSIIKTGKVQSSNPSTLASGYVSTDGVAQMANIVGLGFASEAGEDSDTQSVVAGILPQLLRSSITEISWTANKSDRGIDDKYVISLTPEVANVLSETMLPGGSPDLSLLDTLPHDLPSITLYDLRNPQVAWRSLILIAGKQTDPVTARVIEAASSLLLEPYGIENGETFLSAAGHTIITANAANDGEGPVVLATVIDKDKILKSLRSVLKPVEISAGNRRLSIWRSDDGELSAIINDKSIVLGETDSLLKCCVAEHGQSSIRQDLAGIKFGSGATIKTISTDRETPSQIVEALAEKKSEDSKAVTTLFTETRFTRLGIERRTTSNFGLIGAILANLHSEQY